MSYENNYMHVCRTCLTENCSMKSVFSVEEFMEQTASLSDILMSCASVQVYKDDGLPEQVCLACAQEMSRAFLFRKLCEKSEATLRHCMRTLLPLPVENTCNSYFVSPEIIQDDKSNNLFPKTDEFLPKEQICDPQESAIIETGDSFHDDSSVQSEEEVVSEKRKLRKRHVDIKPNKKSYSCKVCEEVCYGLGAYRHHMTNRHEQINKCSTCGKVFRTEKILHRHRNLHHQASEPSENEENHERVKTKSKKPYKNKTGIIKQRNLPRTCTICNKTFRFHSNLERHKLIHTGERPYLCNVCGKGFAQLSYLKIHSFIHTGEKPYSCKMCDKSFAAPGTLMTHIRTHTGERPHVCKICGKDFPQSGYLSAHIRTHTGEKPVECKVCQRRFNQSGRLIIHMRIHSGEKPYQCKDCGRSFAVKGTLKKHIRTHTGERPYICSVCGQAFAQSGTLATHMKVHKVK